MVRGYTVRLKTANDSSSETAERAGALPCLLRSTRVLGCRFAARLQTRCKRRWFVESFAATRGDLSCTLRVDEGLLAGVAGGSTKGSARRFRNGRVVLRRSVFSHHSAATNQERKTANNGAAANWLGAGRASPARAGTRAEPVAELESFGVPTAFQPRRPTKRHSACDAHPSLPFQHSA